MRLKLEIGGKCKVVTMSSVFHLKYKSTVSKIDLKSRRNSYNENESTLCKVLLVLPFTNDNVVDCRYFILLEKCYYIP